MTKEEIADLEKLAAKYLSEHGLVPFLALIGHECDRSGATWKTYADFFTETINRQEGESYK